MRTSRPFSTISYNSTEHLIAKLDDLVKRRKIDFYAFIEHLPEEDQEKRHKHLLIVPNGYIQTDDLKPYIDEYDPTHPDKPFSILPCRTSKFTDWYLYALHDRAYLAMNNGGQTRKYHYTKDDIICNDYDYLTELLHTSDMSKYQRISKAVEGLEKGESLADLVKLGIVPITQLNQYKTLADLLWIDETRRARKNTNPEYAISNPEDDPFSGQG